VAFARRYKKEERKDRAQLLFPFLPPSFLSPTSPPSLPRLPLQLFSLPFHDIDLPPSNHFRFPFATAFSAFLKEHHPEIPQTRIAKIESNPEQSKHLETAKQDVMGMELDYVNLRKEGYTEGSRIPSMMVSFDEVEMTRVESNEGRADLSFSLLSR